MVVLVGVLAVDGTRRTREATRWVTQEARGLELNMAPVAVSALLGEVEALVAPQFLTKGVRDSHAARDADLTARATSRSSGGSCSTC